MEISTPATSLLLLLCVSALCITTTTGSYYHKVHERQIEVNQLRECQAIVFQVQCNNGLVQESVNLALECNLTEGATVASESCRRNSAGEYCALAYTYLVNGLGIIATECATAASTGCTLRCRNLLMLIRSEMGCCINVAFNNSESPIYNPIPFRNSLWTGCDVEPVTEECGPSNIELQTLPLDPTCTPDVFIGRAGFLQCQKSLLQPVVDALIEADTCQPYADGALEGCGVDESGTPCYQQAAEVTEAFTTARDSCLGLANCNSFCQEALQNLTNTGGCCVNNLFNGSLAGISMIRYGWMSNEFWEDCGVDTPGMCEIRLNSYKYLLPNTVLVAIVSATVVKMLW